MSKLERLFWVAVLAYSCSLIWVGVEYAYAQSNESLTAEDICTVWAKNAALGATNAMRNVPRKIVPLNRQGLEAAIEHRMLYGPEGIYVWAEDWAENPQFIQESTLFGYDYMVKYLAEHNNQLPPIDEALSLFFNTCMDAREDV